MVRFRTYTYAAALFLASAVFFNADAQVSVRSMATAVDSINRYMSHRASVQGGISVDTVFVHSERQEVNIRFGKSIADYPLRDNDLAFIEDIIRRYLPEHLQGHSISLTVRGDKLERLSSGFYSGRTRADISKTAASGKRWVTPVTHYPAPDRGLAGHNIALWAGHGYYYSGTEDRWKWQRAPFFSTIEDLLPHSYLTGFLAPMLENAGAGVIMPRERDSRRTEIVIDNGDPFYTERNGGSEAWTDAPGTGFALPSGPLMPGDNPFRAGTARMVKCNTRSSSSASYLPRFPETGDYAVYVSYKTVEKSSPALYTVRHSGGDTRFVVDQSFGGGTWVYLGTFRFSQGETGQGVIVQNSAPDSPGEGVVTTDAVKFGGGMGNVLRGEETSGFPRYAEAGRYWMQWSGFPEEVYSLNEGEDDYRDDFMSRGEWVNRRRIGAQGLNCRNSGHIQGRIRGEPQVFRRHPENYSQGAFRHRTDLNSRGHTRHLQARLDTESDMGQVLHGSQGSGRSYCPYRAAVPSELRRHGMRPGSGIPVHRFTRYI